MKRPLTYEEFQLVYSKVPRLNVELIIVAEQGVLLTKRTIEPYKDGWHLPGGTVYFGETFEQAVRRVALEELNLEVVSAELFGYIEYPSTRDLNVFTGWPMGIAFLVKTKNTEVTISDEASQFGFFKQPPETIIPEQAEIITKALYA